MATTRQAIPARPAPPPPPATDPHENPLAKISGGLPNSVKAVVNDITTGSQQLLHMGQAAAQRVRAGYQRMKSFVNS